MKFKNSEELAKWNDQMVLKYHKEGTLFESRNFILKSIEKRRVKLAIKLAEIKKEDIILDLGCGEGYLLSLLPKTKEIIGIDISRIVLSKARKLLRSRKDIKLMYCNAENILFRREYFDKILCSEVLEHTPNPKKVIKEIYRILKQDGILVVSIPNEKRIKTIFNILDKTKLKKILFAKRKEKDYEWHLHETDINFLKNITKGLFHIIKIKKIPFPIGYRYVIKLKK